MNTKNINMKKALIYGLVLVIAGFWGFSFFATSVLVQELQPIQIQAVRWLIASLFFGFFVITGKIKLDLSKSSAKYLAVVGLCEPCIYMIFETYGIAMTSSSVASIFIAIIPCMILLINTIFFHHKTSPAGVISIIMAFAGVVICTVFSPDFSLGGKLLGYVCMIGAVITGSVYSMASNKVGGDYGAMEVTAVMAFMGMTFFNTLNFVMGYGLKTYTAYFTNYKLLIGILFLGVCCSALCYMSFNKVLSMVDPAVGNNLAASMTTVIGVIAGIVFAGDAGGIYTVAGLLLTISGVCIASRQL